MRGIQGDSKVERDGGGQGKTCGWRETMKGSVVARQRQRKKGFWEGGVGW